MALFDNNLKKTALERLGSLGGSSNIASQIANPNLISNITSQIPGGQGGKVADILNRQIAGVSNQDLGNIANQVYQGAQNFSMPSFGGSNIDPSTGLERKLPTGGDMSILDPALRGLGSLGTSIKEGVTGLFSSDPSKGPGVGDRLSQGLGEAKDKIGNVLEGGLKGVGGGLAAAQQFAAQNKNLLNLGVQGIAGYAGYQAGKEAREQAANLYQQQLAETQGLGSKFQGIDYDPQRYAEQQQFLRDRIAGGGYTAEEKQMQQQGDVRGARASAAARLAGVEQMARLTGGTGSGAALASALTGGQAMGNIQAETEAARQASAIGKKESAIGQQAQILRQKTAEEADLAKQQADQAAARQSQVGAIRASQVGNIIDKAKEEAGFYSSLANLGSNVITSLETPEEKAKREAATKREESRQQAEIDLLNRSNLPATSSTSTTTQNRQPSTQTTQQPPTTQQAPTTQPAQRTEYVTAPQASRTPATNQPNMSVNTQPIQNVLAGGAQRVANQFSTPIKQVTSSAANIFNQQNMTPKAPVSNIPPKPAAQIKPAVPQQTGIVQSKKPLGK